VYGRDEDGQRVVRRGGGGLVTALDSLATHHDVTWIASAISDEDRAVVSERGDEGLEERSRSGSPYRLRLVAHDPAAYHAFYNIVANPMLWFVQHRLWDLARAPALDEGFRQAWDEGYGAVNRAFAAAVVVELEHDPEATVFFHDYHLYLAPQMVRVACPDAVLAQFVHIPWIGPDGWSVLPGDVRAAVHKGLLANDLVGFHTERWRRAFMDAAVGILGAERVGEAIAHQGRLTLTVARPISVDVAEFDLLAEDERVLARRERLRAARPERLILRVDRTDPSKNILRGLRAFELLLERHPEHRGRAGLLALLDPSRTDIPEYAAYIAEIERAAAAVNVRQGAAVVDLRIADDFPLSVAAYAEYDVLLVNAIFDGLNLVAKEGPLLNERDGVLVLSENTGAAEELGAWALVVNPFDIGQQAEALHAALTMPVEERRARLEAIRGHVRAHDLAAWAVALLGDLDRLTSPAPR
jgi:trehalose 6-phosphate synthase